MTQWHSKACTRSPAPRFQPSTPVATGTGPNYKACSCQGASQGSWTETDGRAHSFHSPHAPRCRRSDAGGSPVHSWLNTAREDKSAKWNNNNVPDRKQEWFLSFPHHWICDPYEWSFWKVKYCLFHSKQLRVFIGGKRHYNGTQILSGSHLCPLPCDPDKLAGVAVAALCVRRSDQVHTVHLMDLLLVAVHTLQDSSSVTASTRLTALWEDNMENALIRRHVKTLAHSGEKKI